MLNTLATLNNLSYYAEEGSAFTRRHRELAEGEPLDAAVLSAAVYVHVYTMHRWSINYCTCGCT